MRAYDLPLVETYRFPAISLAAVATVNRFIGPLGKTGRVLNLSWLVTTVLVGAPSPVVAVDQTVALATTPKFTIPTITAVNIGGTATKAVLKAASTLTKDLVCNLNVTTLTTSGNADVVVTVGWFE